MAASYPVAVANGIAIVGSTGLLSQMPLDALTALSASTILAHSAVVAALLGFTGAAVGSFVALVSIRWPRGQPFLIARSHCPGCGRTLRAFELVPLVSYLIQHGRCRRCSAVIPLRYPLVELVAAAIGIAAAVLTSDVQHAFAAALLGWWLLLLALLDGEHHWLPSTLTLPLLAAGLAVCAGLDPAQLGINVIGAAAGWASLAAVAAGYRNLRHRDGLGGGDVKLFAASGAWLGWDRLPLVLLGAALTALLGVLVWRRRFSATDRLPFGVFLAAATWVVYLLQP